MVGEGIAPLTATPERSVTVSRYSALQHEGLLSLRLRSGQASAPFAVDFVVAVAVEQRQVGVAVVRRVAIPVMHFHNVLCREA